MVLPEWIQVLTDNYFAICKSRFDGTSRSVIGGTLVGNVIIIYLLTDYKIVTTKNQCDRDSNENPF